MLSAKKLEAFSLPMIYANCGETKYNRTKQKYTKDHWIDALCVSHSGKKVWLPKWLKPLYVKACGRGNRQKCRVDQFGFPRTSAKQNKRIENFCSGDMVKAIVKKGKKKGTYIGRVAVRSNGYFNVKIAGKKPIQGISYSCCKLLQYSDGYNYS